MNLELSKKDRRRLAWALERRRSMRFHLPILIESTSRHLDVVVEPCGDRMWRVFVEGMSIDPLAKTVAESQVSDEVDRLLGIVREAADLTAETIH